jgi:hypothetical protein
MALEQPFSLFVGETKGIAVTVIGGVNITGWNIAFNLWRLGPQIQLVLTKTVAGGGITIINGPGSQYQINWLAADGITLGPGLYWHESDRTDTGQEGILTYGNVTVKAKPPVIL